MYSNKATRHCFDKGLSERLQPQYVAFFSKFSLAIHMLEKYLKAENIGLLLKVANGGFSVC